MLFIVSGASRSGKSIAAQRLLEESNIPYLPIDSLVMGFTNGMPESGIHDELWPDEIATRIWEFLKAVCENMIASDTDYLLEGEAFLPEYVQELLKKYPGKVRSCFLGFSKTTLEDKISKVKKHPQIGNDWLNAQPDCFIANHIKNMIGYSLRIENECKVNNIRYFDSSDNFIKTIDNVTEYLKKGLLK